MEKTNGEDILSKAEKKEKRMSYSVETPYGFHLDLDFLKYVHDIEKGNTIKRIHIHRRAKQSKFSTLPRNFSVPDNGSQSYTSSSSRTWSPTSYKSDVQGNISPASESSLRLRYLHDLNYRKKDHVFDTQKHIGDIVPEGLNRFADRPQFMRASSMPAALPQSTTQYEQNQYLKLPQSANSDSESTIQCLEGSRHGGPENQFTAALKRIKDLEEQLETITELKKAILELEGENCKLNTQLKSISELLTSNRKENENVKLIISESEAQPEAITGNVENDGDLGCSSVSHSIFLAIKKQITELKEQLDDSTKDCHNLREILERQKDEMNAKNLHIVELKNTIDTLEEMISRKQKEDVEYKDVAVNTEPPPPPKDEQKGKSFSDYISFVTQSVASATMTTDLEQTLDEKNELCLLIDTDHPAVRACPEVQPNITSDSDMNIKEAVASFITVETEHLDTHISQSHNLDNTELGVCITEDQTPSDASVGQYVKRIQDLLQEQWTCLEHGYPDLASAIKQPASKLSSIQGQLVNSLNLLSSAYSIQAAPERGHSKMKNQHREAVARSSLKSIMKKKNTNSRMGGSEAQAKKNLQFVGVNGGYETTSSEDSSSSEEYCDTGKNGVQIENVLLPVSEEKETAQEDPEPLVASSQLVAQRYAVSDAFRGECQKLSNHLAELQGTTDNQLRQTLYTVCQEWFRVSSQKTSSSDLVAVYLEEFSSICPQLLQMVVNMSDENGNTAMHYSVSHSNFRIVKLLLKTGVCEVDNQNKAGYTPVMLTVLASTETEEDMEVVLTLLNHGNVNLCATQGGQTSLMLAVSHGRLDMVKVLLNCGADVNLKDEDGETALMMACQLGNMDIVKLLLAQPECDPELSDKVGNTALSIVLKSAHSEIAEFLQAHTEHRRSRSAAEMEKGAPL
ncbi:KN motif and ankyrin repeat domain-containing protein 4 [Xenopus laevis]|uniref:KN motif and ankyrin repeat domain-containing protein 4 n=1 Tax=Xenopus laevis TaxID=8355 RepID=A0A8J1MZA6_XENLA|nr:KN motif and ankyrin repeat domain-containing protein 4 [Xenopus laevis]XP_041446330.1 KN motif and ankyrin repeat domain-containing protein 4 [Xenopus laevis]